MRISSQNKDRFIELMKALDPHDFFYPEPFAKRLSDCGLKVRVAEDKKSIFIGTTQINVQLGEWGDPGISPLSVLATVHELSIGPIPISNYTGLGFRYSELLDKLEKQWGKNMRKRNH